MNITWGLIFTRDKASVLVGERGCIFIHSCSVQLISFEVMAGPEYALGVHRNQYCKIRPEPELAGTDEKFRPEPELTL